VKKPWYFLCTKKYWCGFQKKNKDQIKSKYHSIQDEEEEEVDPQNFEAIPESLKVLESTGECLKIRGLRKEFGEKVAVNNLNLTIYQG